MVATIYRLGSIEYYLPGPSGGTTSTPSTGATIERDQIAYYLDAPDEAPGTWISYGRFVRDGTQVEPVDMRRLAAGFDPRTGESLVQRNVAKRMAGYDLQLAAPKSVSILWAVGTAAQRNLLEAAQARAVRSALDMVMSEGLIETRRGKGGLVRERALELAIATFPHRTNREAEPQVHTHCIILNACVREDGTTGSIDNPKLMFHKLAVGAAYRAALARELSKIGLTTEADRRYRFGFQVRGVPDALCSAQSTRRRQIEAALAEQGITSAESGRLADIAAKGTRKGKRALSRDPEVLREHWHDLAQELGIDQDAIWDEALGEADCLAGTGPDIGPGDDPGPGVSPGPDPEPDDRGGAAHAAVDGGADGVRRIAGSVSSSRVTADDDTVDRLVLMAIDALAEQEAVLERRHVLRAALERAERQSPVRLGYDEVAGAIERLVSAGDFAWIGSNERGAVYATPTAIATEKRMLRAAMDRQNERVFFAEAVIAEAVGSAGLSEEQRAAVRHALGPDGVVVIEGRPGAGKSFAQGPVAAAARQAGYRVYAIAPTWRATEVLRRDTKVAAEHARALAGFVARLDPAHADPLRLDERSLVILDEASMLGLRDAARLLEAARDAGAKVILTGDTRQLTGVGRGGGDALGSLANALGRSVLSEVRRQAVPWQRAASEAAARGDMGTALDAYAARGDVTLGADRAAAVATMAVDYVAALTDRPDRTALMVGRRNVDVRDLNAAARRGLRASGYLIGPDHVVASSPRWAEGRAETLALAVNDRIVFNEEIRIGETILRTNSVARIAALDGGAGADDPLVTVKTETGEVVTARWAAFVGYRAAGARDGTPRVQHAYALNANMAQGETVDQAFVLGHGLRSRSALVAMTRHREGCRIYLDRERLDVTGEPVRAVELSPDGHLIAHDAPDPEIAVASAAGATLELVRERSPSAGTTVVDRAPGLGADSDDREALESDDLSRYVAAQAKLWMKPETRENPSDYLVSDRPSLLRWIGVDDVGPRPRPMEEQLPVVVPVAPVLKITPAPAPPESRFGWPLRPEALGGASPERVRGLEDMVARFDGRAVRRVAEGRVCLRGEVSDLPGLIETIHQARLRTGTLIEQLAGMIPKVDQLGAMATQLVTTLRIGTRDDFVRRRIWFPAIRPDEAIDSEAARTALRTSDPILFRATRDLMTLLDETYVLPKFALTRLLRREAEVGNIDEAAQSLGIGGPRSLWSLVRWPPSFLESGTKRNSEAARHNGPAIGKALTAWRELESTCLQRLAIEIPRPSKQAAAIVDQWTKLGVEPSWGYSSDRNRFQMPKLALSGLASRVEAIWESMGPSTGLYAELIHLKEAIEQRLTIPGVKRIIAESREIEGVYWRDFSVPFMAAARLAGTIRGAIELDRSAETLRIEVEPDRCTRVARSLPSRVSNRAEWHDLIRCVRSMTTVGAGSAVTMGPVPTKAQRNIIEAWHRIATLDDAQGGIDLFMSGVERTFSASRLARVEFDLTMLPGNFDWNLNPVAEVAMLARCIRIAKDLTAAYPVASQEIADRLSAILSQEAAEELRCAGLMASFPFEPKLAKPSTMALWNADIFNRAWRQRRSLDDDQVQGDIIMRWARVLAEERVPDLLRFKASALEAMPWQRIREIALEDPMIWERRTESARAKLVCAVSVIGTAQAIHDAHPDQAKRARRKIKAEQMRELLDDARFRTDLRLRPRSRPRFR
ncbi:MAG: relaxase domain-containing protein [Proteobacteria bacterium]|nr:relaxase domain-containing protein [Pseudomonadota bacterium]